MSNQRAAELWHWGAVIFALALFAYEVLGLRGHYWLRRRVIV